MTDSSVLAERLREMHRNTIPHWSPSGDELRSLLMTQERAAVLVDAADALEREHEQRLTLQHHAADIAEELRMMTAGRDAALADVERLLDALKEIGGRIKGHPVYEELTLDEEIEVGGDTAEFSYLARVADEAINAAEVGAA